jgi:hypothetical protein
MDRPHAWFSAFAVLFGIVLVPTGPSVAASLLAAPPCAAGQRVVECLAAHHAELFAVDEERFGRMLEHVEREARRCAPGDRTREFIELVRTIRADGWVAESVTKTVEHLLKEKPQCFLDALSGAEPEARVWVTRVILKPSLHSESPRHWITSVMQKYRNQPRYEQAMREYFEE